ncbi:hypothetical protein [Pelagibacterium sediminicola]|uniref:hypothetical protein n=1 Tax=Pelagibacterium sediminicola TaxID=2248761 RepID=UPI000E31099E|nr:hypothetical protein [Pelagibacterium sediminicola]
MNLLHDITMVDIVSRIAAMLIFVMVHGGVLALLARLLGSFAPERAQRLTLNPFAHLSLWGLAMAVLFRTGWIRPLHIDPAELRGGRASLALIALAAILVSLALVPLLDLVRPLVAAGLPRTAGYAVLMVIITLQEVSLLSALLAALPFPGLTGGLLLVALFPGKAKLFKKLENPVLAALVICLIAGLITPERLLPVLWPIFSGL